MKQRLWHVSDQEDIQVFVPRPAPPGAVGVTGAVVWAISEARLANYLLPRECPRVCFWRSPTTSAEDAEQFLGQVPHVVAVENRWLPELTSASVWLYELPSEHFSCADENAGYYVSRLKVAPERKVHVGDLSAQIVTYGAELRSVNNLRQLASQIASSSLSFSIIRLRNAQPVPDAA